MSYLKDLVAEFVGTFLLVFTVGANIMAENTTWGAMSIAAVLMVCIYTFGPVSGGHFNPAVTFACWASGNMGKDSPAMKTLLYIAIQLLAGMVGGISYGAMFGGLNKPLQPAVGYYWGSVMTVEVLYTFMLCFVVLRAACSSVNPKENEYFGLAIGFVILAGGYAAGGVSGGAFNPAVAFGIDVASATLAWSFAYTLFQLLGAFLAVVVNYFIDVPAGGEAKINNTARCFISEFIGTYFLVLTVGLNVLFGTSAAPLSIAASLMVMIYALGNVSGGHFNPAVTTALVLSKKVDIYSIPVYMGAQILGGLFGGITYMQIVGRAPPLGPNVQKGFGWVSAAGAEIIFTFLLCSAVLHTATLTDRKDMLKGGKAKQVYGLAIAFSIVAGGFAIGGVSGASLNPAVSIGLDTAHAIKHGGAWMNCLAYSMLELIGAAMASGVFYVTREEESEPLVDLANRKTQVAYGAA